MRTVNGGGSIECLLDVRRHVCVVILSMARGFILVTAGVWESLANTSSLFAARDGCNNTGGKIKRGTGVSTLYLARRFRQNRIVGP